MKKFFYLLLLIPALALSCEKAESPEETEKPETEAVNESVYTVTKLTPETRGQIHGCTISPGPGGVTANFSGLMYGCYPLHYVADVMILNSVISSYSDDITNASTWIPTTMDTSYKVCISYACAGGHSGSDVFFVNVGQGGGVTDKCNKEFTSITFTRHTGGVSLNFLAANSTDSRYMNPTRYEVYYGYEYYSGGSVNSTGTTYINFGDNPGTYSVRLYSSACDCADPTTHYYSETF